MSEQDPEPTTRPGPQRNRGEGDGSAQPERVGPHRVEGELGRGGMGVVLRAYDERLHRPVALKALPASLARIPAEVARLEREARALACVSHPNVAGIHGLEEAGGELYLVLELVAGEPLCDRLGHGPLPVGEALDVARQVAAGLSAVHRRGLVHGDLKPSNVVVTPEGVAKLIDFGLARHWTTHQATEITQCDHVVGTAGYISPEQLRGEALDARSDAWAWACVVFECLAGFPPFAGANGMERNAAALEREPPWEQLPRGTPEALRALLRRCLAKKATDRPPPLAEELRALDDGGVRAPPSHPFAGTGGAVALPAERDAFVGRARELAALSEAAIEGGGLVSVLGLGGIGKTRLVLRFAHESAGTWPGGVSFCDLTEARDVDGILRSVSSALGLLLGPGEGVARIGHAIAGRGRCLIVLDNLEQVARHVTETLGPWLDRCPEAVFVVTTREVLGLAGERSVLVAPLDLDDSIALFRQRAVRRAGTSDAAPDGRLAELVRLLDGLPLAIELAAARTRVMTVDRLLARMGQRFRVLAATGKRRDRQSTLRATLDWSWDLLVEPEKAGLAQLSAFEGGFTLEAGAAAPRGPWAARRTGPRSG